MFIYYITTNGYTLLTTVLLTPSPLLTIVYVNIETKSQSSIVSNTLHIISKKKIFYFSEL